MNYEELKSDYLKHLRIGLIASLCVHLFCIALLLLIKPDKSVEQKEGYSSKFTYIDLGPNNVSSRPPSIVEDLSGGGGSSAKAASGTPVPVKDLKKAQEFDLNAGIKGDSTKKGTGGSGSGSGTGGGVAAAPVNVFKKSDYLVAVEMQPEPMGGYSAIDKKVIYPEQARKNSVKGKVFLQVYINENGEVVFAEVLKGLGYGCDEAALRAIKLVRFKAGKQKGKYVKVQMSVPVNFIQ
jgi:TonB family protein